MCDCKEDRIVAFGLSWKNIVSSFVGPSLIALIIGGFASWGIVQATVIDQKHTNAKMYTIEEKVDQEAKRNNIQDVTISQVQEKTSNLESTLNRIENNMGALTRDLKDFMQDMPKEIRSLTKEISEVNKVVAVLKDRDAREVNKK